MKQSNGKVKSEKLSKPQKKLTKQLNFTQIQQAKHFPSETCATDKIVQFKCWLVLAWYERFLKKKETWSKTTENMFLFLLDKQDISTSTNSNCLQFS